MRQIPTLLFLTGCFAGLSPILGFSTDPSKKDGSPYFAHAVREDIFIGFSGNDEALKRGLANCEEALKKNPKHAEAMVWKGAAGVYLAGKLIQGSQTAEGMVETKALPVVALE